MAKKSAKLLKQKKKPLSDLLPKNEEEYLERLIAHSEKVAVNAGPTLEEYFMNQANNIRKRLEELRKRK